MARSCIACSPRRWISIPIFSLLLFGFSCTSEPRFVAVEQQPETDRLRRLSASHPPPPDAAATAGQSAEPLTEAPWSLLRRLDVKTGHAGEALERLNGTKVKLAGYMVPFSDELETVSEFLLVPSAGMCVHKPAPPANQIVLVQMQSAAARVEWSRAVEVTGALHIDSSDSPFGSTSFRMLGVSLTAR